MGYLKATTPVGIDMSAAPKTIRDAVEAWRHAALELKTAERNLAPNNRSTQEHRLWLEQVAKSEDAKLLAASLREGKPDPGTPNLDGLRVNLAAAERERDARRILADDALTAANRVINAHGEAWRAAEAKNAERQRARLGELVAELAGTLTELTRAEGIRSRIERDVLGFDPAEQTPLGVSLQWQGQTVTHGQPVNAQQLLTLLTQLTAAPEKPTLKTTGGGRLFVTGGTETDLTEVYA